MLNYTSMLYLIKYYLEIITLKYAVTLLRPLVYNLTPFYMHVIFGVLIF